MRNLRYFLGDRVYFHRQQSLLLPQTEHTLAMRALFVTYMPYAVARHYNISRA